MHPRQQLRSEIVALLRDALPEEIPVLDSQVSDVEKNPVSVLVYSAGESVERAPGAGSRPGTPVRRRMQTNVIVVSSFPGDGPDAWIQADDVSRAVEIAMNVPFDPGLDLLATDISQAAGEETLVQVSMLYETVLTDTMEN